MHKDRGVLFVFRSVMKKRVISLFESLEYQKLKWITLFNKKCNIDVFIFDDVERAKQLNICDLQDTDRIQET